MKHCPTCSRTYTDPGLNYCLTDGSQLVLDSEPTIVMERPRERKKSNAIWLIFGGLILFLLGGGLAGGLVYSFLAARSAETANASRPAANPQRKATPSPSPSSSPTVANEQAPVESAASDTSEITPIGWDTNALLFKGEAGQTYTFECPPNGTAGIVYGNDVYTADSSICTSAVHAGIITLEDGGTVTIEYRPGRVLYGSTVRNGIKSYTFGEYTRSFAVRKADIAPSN